MAYRVGLTTAVEADTCTAFERIREAAQMHAKKWLIRLFEEILSLDEMPTRCPVIPECDELGFTAHHLLLGKGRSVYRTHLLQTKEEEQHVRVLRVWHGFRNAINAAGVDEALAGE
jgi:plasmid stabilization system protein ParE